MPSTIERLLPEYDFRTRHSRWIDADPARVWRELRAVRFDELTLTRPLVRVRGLGRRLPSGSVFDEGPVTILTVDAEREAVGGAIAQSWRPRPAHRPVDGVDQFVAFGEPGWVKFLTDFRVCPDEGGTRLSTETRVVATDARAKALFTPYWALIRGFSVLVRRDLLRAVARRAERPAP